MGNTNFIAGDFSETTYHNFFVFDLSGVTDMITGGTLNLNTYTVSGFATKTYTLVDVTTDVSSLTAGTGGAAAYADLGSGAVFGTREYTTGDANQVRGIALGGDFVTAANAARGGLLAVGGYLSAGGGYAFGASGDAPQSLILTTIVPEPAAGAACCVAASFPAGARRTRREPHPRRFQSPHQLGRALVHERLVPVRQVPHRVQVQPRLAAVRQLDRDHQLLVALGRDLGKQGGAGRWPVIPPASGAQRLGARRDEDRGAAALAGRVRPAGRDSARGELHLQVRLVGEAADAVGHGLDVGAVGTIVRVTPRY